MSRALQRIADPFFIDPVVPGRWKRDVQSKPVKREVPSMSVKVGLRKGDTIHDPGSLRRAQILVELMMQLDLDANLAKPSSYQSGRGGDILRRQFGVDDTGPVVRQRCQRLWKPRRVRVCDAKERDAEGVRVERPALQDRRDGGHGRLNP